MDKVSSYTTWTSNLTCEADGKPAPKFLWFRNKTLVTTEPGGNYKILATEGKSILQVKLERAVCKSLNWFHSCELSFI